MLNCIFFVGIIEEVLEEGLRLRVKRSYKNCEGIYDEDFFDINLWEGIKNSILKYSNKNDIIVIKARLENEEKKILIIAERVVFLRKEMKKDIDVIKS